MRGQLKNNREVWYALYSAKTPVKDSDGYETGEYTSGYGDPVKLLANISTGSGRTATYAFGTFKDYEYVITIFDMNCPIDEFSQIWYMTTTDKSANYKVTAVRRGLDSILIAIKRVATGA